jgi:hypothetical protein
VPCIAVGGVVEGGRVDWELAGMESSKVPSGVVGCKEKILVELIITYRLHGEPPTT